MLLSHIVLKMAIAEPGLSVRHIDELCGMTELSKTPFCGGADFRGHLVLDAGPHLSTGRGMWGGHLRTTLGGFKDGCNYKGHGVLWRCGPSPNYFGHQFYCSLKWK